MSKKPLEIAPPTKNEASRLVELFMADMLDLGQESSAEAMLAVTEQMLADGSSSILRVARDGRRVVGVLLANEFLSIKFPGKALWIEELYVAPEARRRGLGRQLVEHLLEWAHVEGYVGVELEAYRMNTAASVLYRSLGFRRLARERYAFDMVEYEREESQ